jgi:hypothetical protein
MIFTQTMRFQQPTYLLNFSHHFGRSCLALPDCLCSIQLELSIIQYSIGFTKYCWWNTILRQVFLTKTCLYQQSFISRLLFFSIVLLPFSYFHPKFSIHKAKIIKTYKIGNHLNRAEIAQAFLIDFNHKMEK